MKFQACLLKILLLTAVLVLAGSSPARASAKPPLEASGAKIVVAPKAAPAPEPKIPGFVISRANGGYLSLLVDENGNLRLTFYDAKKKAAPVDVARARARWSVRYKATDVRTVLIPTADGSALTSPLVVRPPYIYRIYLSLFVDGSEEAVESYPNLDFRQ